MDSHKDAQSTEHNPYLTGYSKPSTQHHEWRTAENSAGHLLPVLKRMVAEQPQRTLLDVGAGSGTITADFASLMPQGRVIGTDVSEEILRKAKALADERGIHNLEVKQGDAYHLPFEDDSFDIVHASMILGHLDKPHLAVGEMIRVAKKPGGVISLRESDLRGWSLYPELAGLKAYQNMLCAVHEANGGTVNAAARLVSWVLTNGIGRPRVQASAGTWCYSTPEDRAMWSQAMITRCSNGPTRERALALGLAKEEDLEDMRKAWEQWASASDGYCGCLNGEVIIRL